MFVESKVKRHLICTMTIIFGLTTSCSYYPRFTSAPLIKEKGDTRIEGGIGVSYSFGGRNNK